MYDLTSQQHGRGLTGITCPVKLEVARLKQRLREFAQARQIPV